MQWRNYLLKGDKMKEIVEIATGISITNQCIQCQSLNEMCPDCDDLRQARDTYIAHQLVEEGSIQYSHQMAFTGDEPSGHDWVSPVNELQKHAILLDGSIKTDRHEFLDPTTNLADRLSGAFFLGKHMFLLDESVPHIESSEAICSSCHYTYNKHIECPNCN